MLLIKRKLQEILAEWLFPTLQQADKIVHWSASKSIRKDLILRLNMPAEVPSQPSLSLQQDGIISVQDIDLVMSEGLGMRYAFIGPMETMHLNAPKGNAPTA